MNVRSVPSCSNTSSNNDYCFPNPSFEEPYDYATVPKFFLAIFLLFANVLLLNMLIAVFRYVGCLLYTSDAADE